MTESPARDIFGHIDWNEINYRSATSPWDNDAAVRARLQRAAEIYLPPDVYS